MNAISIPLDFIIYDSSLYPRGKFDQEVVNRYRQAIDLLPPIQLTHENILIDGYHRLIAYRIEQKKTIRATVEQLDRKDVLWEATKRNAIHGLQLSMTDKRKLARCFFSKNNVTQAEIADVLSVDPGSVSRWVRDLKEGQDKERDEKIWQTWLACQTYDEIAQTVGYADESGPRKIVERIKLQMQDFPPPDSLQLYNLWNFQTCDDRYGVDYPGRIPGQIIENILYYYTEPFDTVIDPMAGSGTAIDVCKTMNRRYRAYDLKPIRDDITTHDITCGFPPECKGCNLIFLDPPYWKQRKGDYSDGRTNLANFALIEFYDRMKAIFNDAHNMLVPGGYLAIIVSPTQDKGTIHDHAYVFYQQLSAIFCSEGGQFTNRIIIPYTTQQVRPYHMSDARKGRYMLKLYRDLLIYRKGQ